MLRLGRLILLGAAACCLAVGLVVLLLRDRGPSPAEVRERAEALGKRHGILIGYGDPSTFFISPYGPKDAFIPGTAAARAEPAALPAALDGIESSLKAYPPGFFARLAGAIFICGSLTMDGAEAGGTYGPAWLVLAAPRRLGREAIFEGWLTSTGLSSPSWPCFLRPT